MGGGAYRCFALVSMSLLLDWAFCNKNNNNFKKHKNETKTTHTHTKKQGKNKNTRRLLLMLNPVVAACSLCTAN